MSVDLRKPTVSAITQRIHPCPWDGDPATVIVFTPAGKGRTTIEIACDVHLAAFWPKLAEQVSVRWEEAYAHARAIGYNYDQACDYADTTF